MFLNNMFVGAWSLFVGHRNQDEAEEVEEAQEKPPTSSSSSRAHKTGNE